MKCTDYTAQNVSFGSMHFAAVDMGDDIILNFRMQKALGSENVREFNQCVVKHLALSLEWWLNGRRFRIPTRTRVDVMGAELRAGEFAQAQLRRNHISSPTTTREHELWSSVHDAMTTGHDRSFKRLGWLFKELRTVDPELRIRIYDYEQTQCIHHVIAYRYSNGGNEAPVNESTNLVVVGNHIRFLLHWKETYPGSWQRWREYVDGIRVIEWLSRRESLETDDTSPSDAPNLACNVCGEKCKTLLAYCGGCNDGVNGPINIPVIDGMEWRNRSNPWIHEQIESGREVPPTS